MEVSNVTLHLWINNQFQSAINASGEQPLEAVRIRPFHYRCYHLQAMVYLAHLASALGVDLFHLTNKQGGSIQAAIDFVLNHVTPQPGTEDPTELVPLLYTAIEQYGDGDGEVREGDCEVWRGFEEAASVDAVEASNTKSGEREAD